MLTAGTNTNETTPFSAETNLTSISDRRAETFAGRVGTLDDVTSGGTVAHRS